MAVGNGVPADSIEAEATPAALNYTNTGTFTKSRDGSGWLRRLDAQSEDSKAYLLEKMLSDASSVRSRSTTARTNRNEDLKEVTKPTSRPPSNAVASDAPLRQSAVSATEYRLYPEARCFDTPRDATTSNSQNVVDSCEVHSEAETYVVPDAIDKQRRDRSQRTNSQNSRYARIVLVFFVDSSRFNLFFLFSKYCKNECESRCDECNEQP